MPSVHDILQLSANGIVSGSGYALLGAGFALIYSVTSRFHFAYASGYALAAYAAAQVGQRLGAPFALAVAVGALAAFGFGALVEGLLYRRLAARAGRDALLSIFVASLGLAIVLENAIRLVWLERPIQQISGLSIRSVQIGSVYLTSLDLEATAASWGLIVALAAALAWTSVGRMVRAVRVNPEMSVTVGIDPARIYVLVFAVGSAFSGVAAVFDAGRTAVTPDMGVRPTLFAFVVAFLAGPSRSPLRVGATGLAIGLLESLSGLWLSSQWATPIVFGAVVLYASLRSLRPNILRLRRLAAGEA